MGLKRRSVMINNSSQSYSEFSFILKRPKSNKLPQFLFIGSLNSKVLPNHESASFFTHLNPCLSVSQHELKIKVKEHQRTLSIKQSLIISSSWKSSNKLISSILALSFLQKCKPRGFLDSDFSK